jgi:hypothetical protein
MMRWRHPAKERRLKVAHRRKPASARCAALRPLIAAAACLAVLALPALSEEATHVLRPTDSEKLFLERLMLAESGGQEEARNPRSSALGPYQFLGSTFLDVLGRHFPSITEGKSEVDLLALRTDINIARDAALIYTRENAAFLAERGMEASAAHLRLAFLVGPTGAQRVVSAEPDTPIAQLLGPSALEANPFLRNMTARGLIERSTREADGVRLVTVAAPSGSGTASRRNTSGIRVRCNMGRASCRKWLALATKRQSRRTAAQAQPEKPKN